MQICKSIPKLGNYLNFKYLTFICLLVICLFAYSTPVGAITMTNDNYILRTELDTSGGRVSDSTYNLGISLGQTSPGLYGDGTNYKVKAGFQYLVGSKIPFKFTISETLIDFGILSPTNPVTRTNTLTVSNGSAGGYHVTAYENTPLTADDGSTIPDTTCDNGSCTQAVAATWTSALAYGFGYRCDNPGAGGTDTDCSSDFSTADSYKQFSDLSKQEVPVIVMSGTTKGRNKQSQITYRVNIAGTQAPGNYSNAITYIATPTF